MSDNIALRSLKLPNEAYGDFALPAIFFLFYYNNWNYPFKSYLPAADRTAEAMHKRRSKGRRPRGDGTRGPRSSCASTRSKERVSRSFSACALDFAALPARHSIALLDIFRRIFCLWLCAAVGLPAISARIVAMPMTAALVWRRSKRAPWRALFLIFLLSGVNLEANIGITSEQEKKAVARAKTIADLDESAYAELLSKNQAALTELPIVNSCKLVQVTKLNNSFCSVNLNCTMRCGLEQQPKLRLSQKCPTTAQAAELMLEYLQNNHAECISSARNACSCCATDEQGGSISAASVNAFSRMQETQRQAAQQRAAELRLRTAEQDLERVKRLRTASSNADRAGSGKESQEKASQDHQAIPYFDKYKNWDLSQFRTRMGEAMRRRSTLLSKEATRPEPRDDGSAENDALYHWRRGLIGAIQVNCTHIWLRRACVLHACLSYSPNV